MPPATCSTHREPVEIQSPVVRTGVRGLMADDYLERLSKPYYAGRLAALSCAPVLTATYGRSAPVLGKHRQPTRPSEF